MKRIMQIVTAAVFCAFIGGFGLLHLVTPDRTFSPDENRNLAQFPAFSWKVLMDGSYTRDIETYLADQFPLRDQWIGLKTRYEYLLGKREFSGVYLCGDTLISKVEGSDRADKNLGYVAQLTGKTDIPVYFGLIPTAAEIWRDRLPDGAASFDQIGYIEQSKDTGAIYVDMLGVLADHADEAIYYRTDHHWTSLGAYYGYTALMDAIGAESAPLGEANVISEEFFGTLYSTAGIHWLQPDTMERYIDGEGISVEVNTGLEQKEVGLYNDAFLSEKDKYSSFLGGNNPLYILKNPNAATDEKILVVRDSYTDSLAPFLTQQYAEVHLLDLRYYRTPVAMYAGFMDADAIFICYSVDNFQKDADAIFIGQGSAPAEDDGAVEDNEDTVGGADDTTDSTQPEENTPVEPPVETPDEPIDDPVDDEADDPVTEEPEVNDTPVEDPPADEPVENTPAPSGVVLGEFYAGLAGKYEMPMGLGIVEDEEIIENSYPGLTAYAREQTVFALSMASFNGGEFMAVELADSANAEAVKAIFQGRIDYMVDGGADYPLASEIWQQYGCVAAKGSFVMMIVAPSADAIVADFEALVG